MSRQGNPFIVPMATTADAVTGAGGLRHESTARSRGSSRWPGVSEPPIPPTLEAARADVRHVISAMRIGSSACIAPEAIGAVSVGLVRGLREAAPEPQTPEHKEWRQLVAAWWTWCCEREDVDSIDYLMCHARSFVPRAAPAGVHTSAPAQVIGLIQSRLASRDPAMVKLFFAGSVDRELAPWTVWGWAAVAGMLGAVRYMTETAARAAAYWPIVSPVRPHTWRDGDVRGAAAELEKIVGCVAAAGRRDVVKYLVNLPTRMGGRVFARTIKCRRTMSMHRAWEVAAEAHAESSRRPCRLPLLALVKAVRRGRVVGVGRVKMAQRRTMRLPKSAVNDA